MMTSFFDPAGNMEVSLGFASINLGSGMDFLLESFLPLLIEY